MPDEQTNVVIAPNSVPQSPQPIPDTAPVISQALNQAQDFGAMATKFQQSQEEALQTRLELQSLKEMMQSSQTSSQTEIQDLHQKYSKLVEALEEDEEEEEIQLPANSNGQTTVITPPVITPPAVVVETQPKKVQSRLSRILFGKEEDE